MGVPDALRTVVTDARRHFGEVAKLYDTWIQRVRSIDNPLTPIERVAYLVIDYRIRLDMGAFDGLLDDSPLETVQALRTVRLHNEADVLKSALQRRGRAAQDEALGEIMGLDYDYDTFYDAVGRFLSGNQ